MPRLRRTCEEGIPNMAENEQPQNEEDLAGYASATELARAYRASGAEANKWKTAAEQALAKLEAFSAPNVRQDVPQRGNAYERLSALGVPPDDIRDFIEPVIRESIRQEFAPIAEGIQARGKMLTRNKDYAKFEADVHAFVQSDPDLSQSYNRMFSADPVGAMEYAFLKFGDSSRKAHREKHNGDTSVEAQIPSGRSGDSRRAPDALGDVQKAYERYRETGSAQDARLYAKARLRGVIKDEFLNQ